MSILPTVHRTLPSHVQKLIVERAKYEEADRIVKENQTISNFAGWEKNITNKIKSREAKRVAEGADSELKVAKQLVLQVRKQKMQELYDAERAEWDRKLKEMGLYIWKAPI
ncbi:putative protein of unknown function (DUF4558) [Monocercomonoides exilis]|uniref:putative protein of unknown function (DUF4558) n=1 Tax=Monocercomonoides exilis TaxID=2049356 RepID=UPI00355AC918|nr:putative protein of unknown function (DUF4558) [Monocercomonoides exilis]|eukprot:MONOS_6115.1-p1 / transcript=MONOS_6115.1 / gene=MONOS_6115 / organism=Monocercomonoides_exilis_PA203 / gene_product=unspecified product / transcript_product=unspecified product / location=Mono_scaffold00188:66696-67133(-) / protein_length=110 / sequence_SO=supercontig / SO=protein_coding / is_pseudo=false